MRIRQLTKSLLVLTLLHLCSCSMLGVSNREYSKTYTIRRGDTLSGVGDRYGVSPSLLQDINDIDDPRQIAVGTVIYLPDEARLRPSSPSTYALNRKLQQAPRVTGHLTPNYASENVRTVSLTGVRQYRNRLILPVQGARLSSPFGFRGGRFHEGVDLCVQSGTEIHAAHSGKVVYVSEHFSRYGKIVVIQGEGLITVYGHNRKNRVSIGDEVEKGDWIADVGATGDATGPHVHFEVRVKDAQGRYNAVDPFLFLGRTSES